MRIVYIDTSLIALLTINQEKECDTKARQKQLMLLDCFRYR